MQVEHDELEAKIKEGEDQLVAKREEYLKFNKAGFQIDAWNPHYDWFHFRRLLSRLYYIYNFLKWNLS